MKIVMVEWVDARFSNMWEHRNEEIHIISCVTIGILKRENEEEIEVCLHINEEMKAGCMAIPKRCINSIKKLKVR